MKANASTRAIGMPHCNAIIWGYPMAGRLDLALRNTDRVFPLQPGQTLTAGRTAQSDIQLDDPSVSRRHCMLALLSNGLLQVTDLESANGTFVNERPIKEATARPGDLIRLGAAILEVRDSSGVSHRPDQTIFVDEGTVESVIQKRIEPSDFGWLKPTIDGAAPELALLKRAQRHLATLHHVSELLAGARDIPTLSDATLRTILEVLSADRGAIVLRGRDGGDGDVLAARSKTQPAAPFAVSRTLVSDVIARGISIFAHDASSDIRFADGQSVIGQHVRSVMCVPLRTTDETLGALYVDSLSGAGRFNESDLELLAAIGNQAGVAMHRVRLMGELERLLLDTIKAIAATIDARDGYTHRHSERVAALTSQLSKELGLSDAERETAELSALLHDVGKIAVPDSILNKPGKLTPEEFAEMQKHPVHGARILGNIQSATVKAVLPGVQYHHEKWDGTGYPEGLKAEAIPFLGRLLGVADFYDALTSTRSYRGAMSAEDAMALIVKGSGTHFDPLVAGALIRIFDRGELHLDSMPSEIRQMLPGR
jgi:putative nucleotidyltransferase with HDIG domain